MWQSDRKTFEHVEDKPYRDSMGKRFMISNIKKRNCLHARYVWSIWPGRTSAFFSVSQIIDCCWKQTRSPHVVYVFFLFCRRTATKERNNDHENQQATRPPTNRPSTPPTNPSQTSSSTSSNPSCSATSGPRASWWPPTHES